MLDVSGVGMVGVAVVIAAAVVLIFWMALKGSAPSERPAIIAALASVALAVVQLLRRRPSKGIDPSQSEE